MAYVITAVGAGGKTTYLRNRAQEYLREGKTVAVTTTTHIWPPGGGLSLLNHHHVKTGQLPEVTGRFPEKSSEYIDESTYIDVWLGGGKEPDYYGVQCFDKKSADTQSDTTQGKGKLSALSESQLKMLYRLYDVVLVEGDGSHCMPVKIPGKNEPVIPEGTDEIVVVMGAHAIGRRIDVVCHRYRKDMAGKPGDVLTEEMIRELAERYYIQPLKHRYPDVKLSYVLSIMPRTTGRIKAVLMASGFGRRYGGNKLLAQYRGRPLYRCALDHVVSAFGKENTVVVTQYEQIFNEVSALGIQAVMNHEAEEGIAASIRIGTKTAVQDNMDAVMFFAADMPNIPSREIRLYAEQFLSSGKPFGCVVFGPEHICSNPGVFRLDTGAEKLLSLTGDRGAMRIMKQEPWNIYYYQIAPECAADVDLPPCETSV